MLKDDFEAQLESLREALSIVKATRDEYVDKYRGAIDQVRHLEASRSQARLAQEQLKIILDAADARALRATELRTSSESQVLHFMAQRDAAYERCAEVARGYHRMSEDGQRIAEAILKLKEET